MVISLWGNRPFTLADAVRLHFDLVMQEIQALLNEIEAEHRKTTKEKSN